MTALLNLRSREQSKIFSIWNMLKNAKTFIMLAVFKYWEKDLFLLTFGYINMITFYSLFSS